MTRFFEHRHTAGLDELTPSGQVRLTRFLHWQDACREDFLRRQACWLLAEIEEGVEIVVLECRCEYLSEISASDEIAVRMRLAELTRSQITFTFDYVLLTGESERLVATGRHRVGLRYRDGDRHHRAAVPAALRDALEVIGSPAMARPVVTK